MTKKTKSQPHFIRLSHEATVPMNAVFQRDSEGITVSVPGAVALLPVAKVAGTVADALSAFLDGSVEFPVNANGIIDLPAGWSARRAANDVFTSGQPVKVIAGTADNRWFDTGMEYVDNQLLPKGDQAQRGLRNPVQPPNSSPQISMDKVLERLKATQK